MLLRSLKEHYLEVSKMTPPPKVNPPEPFTVVKGALDANGPVLRRSYGDEQITISVMRLANIIPGGGAAAADDADDINQLFLHVDVSKPGQKESLLFLCGLYPDALGIHSVSIRPMADESDSAALRSTYTGPLFEYVLLFFSFFSIYSLVICNYCFLFIVCQFYISFWCKRICISSFMIAFGKTPLMIYIHS